MKKNKPKPFHENFAQFFENPTRAGLRELLKNNIGELRNCDFKEQWLEASSLSRHILGLANSGGGCLIIGVAENEDKSLIAKGIEAFKDKADITKGIRKFLPESLLSIIDTVNFPFEASEYPALVGKRFQSIFVEYDQGHLPFLALRDGTDIRANAVYVRREGETGEASHEELQRVLNTRIDSGHSTAEELDIRKHLEQLKALYEIVPQYCGKGLSSIEVFNLMDRIAMALTEPNPNYPQETFETFVLRMIIAKKRRIAQELGVPDNAS